MQTSRVGSSGVLPSGAEPVLGELGVPSGNGMSSETLLFEASWKDGGVRKSESLVARVAPDPAAAPVFEAYYLDRQYRAIQEVRELTAVPVPNLRWLETDRSVLGEQFFVMDRVDGVVPTDLPPYALAGWVAEGTPEQRQRLQDTSVKVLADLHAIPDAERAVRVPAAAPHRGEQPAPARPRHPGLLRVVRVRRHPLPADRAHLQLARGQLAASTRGRPCSPGATRGSAT